MSLHLEFATIASGSGGNCIYAASGHTRLLIDAGLSGKKIENGLSDLSLTGWDIDALLVTHEHSDHIAGVGVMSRRYDMPVYATEGTWNAMSDTVGNIKRSCRSLVYGGEAFTVGDLTVEPFSIPHDAADPVGYTITDGVETITVATDIGHITPQVKEQIEKSSILLIESNHDVNMLKNGPYPYQLKQRILSEFGHLSNLSCGSILKETLSSRLKYVFLGHLSSENNTPRLAYDTVAAALSDTGAEIGGDFNMYIAPRQGVKHRVSL